MVKRALRIREGMLLVFAMGGIAGIGVRDVVDMLWKGYLDPLLFIVAIAEIGLGFLTLRRALRIVGNSTIS